MVKNTPNSRRSSSLSQERSLRNRAALVTAAEELWAEGGFETTKVEDVCDRAGVSKGLFYFYFPSKDDLLVELVLSDLDQVVEALSASLEAGDDVGTVLERGCAALVRRAQRRPRDLLARGVAGWFAVPVRHAALLDLHTPLEHGLADVFAHGQATAEIGDGHTPEEMGRLLAGGLMGATLEWAVAASRQPALARRLRSRTELALVGALA